MSRHLRHLVAATAALLTVSLLGAVPAAADTVLLKDGRTVEAPKADKQADGSWVLKFQNGDVTLPADLVKEAWCVGAQGYMPKDDEEKAKLEQGLVPYEGKWIPKAERDQRVAKKTAAAKKRIEEAKAHREWRNRYKEKTSNFEFEYTIPPDIAKGYMELMEAFFAVFAKEFKISKPKEKLKVCFYHDYEAFLEVSGAGYGTLAYYRFVPPLELNFFYDRLRPEETVAVMFHETQHYLCHLMNLKFGMPHCMGEGLSEYFGGSKWDPVKKVMTTGGVQEGRLTEVLTDIQKGERKSLQDYLNGKLGYEDYTWGWTFIHFMMESPKYGKKFRAFYAALPNAKDITRVPYRDDPPMTTVDSASLNKAFRKYMGIEDIAALEKEWHEYIDKNLKITSVVGFEEAAFAAANTGRHIRAKRLFKEAVEKGSKNPTVYLRYGEMIWSGDSSEAERLFRKGLTYDPLSADLWIALGRLIRNKDGQDDAGKKMIQLAAEIDPDNAESALLIEEALEKTAPPPGPKGGEGGD
jgi:tetratricopeptide (TPR) repeat protein